MKELLEELRIIENTGYSYVGNCVNSFDDDGECLIGIYNDVSDFASAEENALEITRDEFY